MKKPKEINVSEFKAKALKFIEDTATKGNEYTLLKKGKPVAKVIPIVTQAPIKKGEYKNVIHTDAAIENINFSEDWEINE